VSREDWPALVAEHERRMRHEVPTTEHDVRKIHTDVPPRSIAVPGLPEVVDRVRSLGVRD
jgi:hypothetical protein